MQFVRKSEASLTDSLTGKEVRLWLYDPKSFARDVPARMWEAMEESGESKRILYSLYEQPHSLKDGETDQRANLQDWIKFLTVSSPTIFLATDLDQEHLIGFIWFTDILHGWRATVHIFVRKPFRGTKSVEIAHLGLRTMFRLQKLKTIWAQTPWDNVKRFAERVGFKTCGTLPEYFRIEGQAKPLHILRLKEAWLHG